MTTLRRTLTVLAVLLTASPTFAQRGSRLSPAAQDAVAERAKIVDAAAESGDWHAAEVACERLVHRAAAWGTSRDLDALREAERGRRLFRFIGELPEDLARPFFDAMNADADLSAHLLFAWDEQEDDGALAARLLLDLIERHPDDVRRLPALASAVALVHDRRDRIRRHVNENTVTAEDPRDVFAFFASNERKLLSPPSRQPVEALAFVVDTTEPIAELEWAMARYRGQPQIGARFFEIEYDTAHFRHGRPKKVTEAGDYRLRMILQHGGVCADQGYFAANVGKALGVPTVTISASSANVAHCWVGYVEQRGRRVKWNMDAGRYEAYQNVEGTVWVPLRDTWRPDSEVAMLAGFLSEPDEDRWDAVAAASAARLWTVSPVEGDLQPLGPGRPGRRSARGRGIEDRLDLLELGLRGCPSYVDGWRLLSDFAGTGELDARQTRRWAGVLERLCGESYPAFAVGVLANMITVRPDPGERDDLWEWAYTKFDERKDIAAKIRLLQAQDAEEQGDLDRAWALRMEVVDRFADDTPVILNALGALERMLRAQGLERDLPGLYERAWARMTRPGNMAGAFATQSNWYRVGYRYHEILTELSDQRAANVLRRLHAP